MFHFHTSLRPLQTSPGLRKLNDDMLFAKYYLYHQKLTQLNINFNAFTEKLHSKYRIENIVQVNNIKTRLPTKKKLNK